MLYFLDPWDGFDENPFPGNYVNSPDLLELVKRVISRKVFAVHSDVRLANYVFMQKIDSGSWRSYLAKRIFSCLQDRGHWKACCR